MVNASISILYTVGRVEKNTHSTNLVLPVTPADPRPVAADNADITQALGQTAEPGIEVTAVRLLDPFAAIGDMGYLAESVDPLAATGDVGSLAEIVDPLASIADVGSLAEASEP